jgi:hypothetical protein
MLIENSIINYFKQTLIIREVSSDIFENLSIENFTILSEIGIPNGVLDFEFTNELVLKSKNELIVGKTHYKSNIVLLIDSGKIIKDDNNSFLANSLSNFIKQMFTYDYLWNVLIKEAKMGHYRENKNHKKYAKFLEDELLKIDINLLVDDENYFWGALIEDIEFGIVG